MRHVALFATLLTLAGGNVIAIAQTGAAASLDKLPLFFIENRGQLDQRVAYYVRGRDTSVYFTSKGVTLALTGNEPLDNRGRQRWAVKLDFVGASRRVRPRGQDLTPAVISYFKGPRSQWKSGLKTYGAVVYRDLWPGIDLIYSGDVHRLKYRFVIKPGANPDQIRLAYRGVTTVRLSGEGQLEVSTQEVPGDLAQRRCGAGLGAEL